MLEELLCQYEELCKSYSDLRLALQEIAKPYTCVKTINGKETMVIDYERWEKEDVEAIPVESLIIAAS